ncbi:MAG TPA: hypothetical protein DCF68_02455 [Cyanothece sp. UBA12306]|nr:hypothetical protein [Cyanothece sp. UBA12306]
MINSFYPNFPNISKFYDFFGAITFITAITLLSRVNAFNSNVRNKDASFPFVQYAVIFKDVFLVNWKFEQSFIGEVPISNTENYYANYSNILTIPVLNNWSVFGTLDFSYFGISQLDETNL